MSRYLRILEKAKLDKDLFGGDPASEETFEYPQTIELEREAAVAEPEPERAAGPVQMEAAVVMEKPTPEPPDEPDAAWRPEMAQLLGQESLPDRMRIGLCPLGGLRSAVDCAAALGQWIAARASAPVLIVEASFDVPQLARLFRTRRLGLAEAMASREPHWDHFVHDTVYAKLKVLPAGRNPSLRQLLGDQAGFRKALDDLDQRFDSIIVVLPNPRVGGFEKLLASDSTDLVFPVIEPGRISASQAAKAMRKLSACSARVAAALVSPEHSVGEATRLEHIAKQLGRPSVGDFHA